MTEHEGHRFPLEPHCPYCGLLGWTVERYGEAMHKHSCPYRTDTKCQSHPDFCEEMGQ